MPSFSSQPVRLVGSSGEYFFDKFGVHCGLLTNGASAILEHILCFDFATRYLNLTAIHLQTSTISY
jgi:hypothetical protein